MHVYVYHLPNQHILALSKYRMRIKTLFVFANYDTNFFKTQEHGARKRVTDSEGIRMLNTNGMSQRPGIGPITRSRPSSYSDRA